jgi:assimilatory nitrate reductase catalytic subunit
MTTKTTCPYCGVGCGVLATSGGVTGDPTHPANFGRLCSKGTALGETMGLEGRLLHPMIAGRQATWDEALDTIAAKFRDIIAQHGPDSVALYVSGQLLTEDYYAANKLAKSVFATANIDSNSRLCMASAVAAHRRAFGEDLVPGIYEDLELADLLVLVGSNTAWCHPVLFQRIVAARAARPAMRVVVIDPRRTATCEAADLHLPLRPGTDVALFNGLLAHLGDQGYAAPCAESAVATARAECPDAATTAALCGLAESDVAAFFALVRSTPRTVTMFSQGVNQSSAGTDKANAIINTHLLTGRIGLPGAGPFSITGQPNAMGGREVGALSNMLAAHLEWDRDGDLDRLRRFWNAPTLPTKPGLKAVDLFRAIADHRVRAIWILGTNPAISLPKGDAVRAALAQCDFVAVSECTADTDTTRLAHVLLPALGWGEKDGTVTNSERVISRQRAFLPVPGEARADWQALAGVAARLGHGPRFAWRGPADIFREHASLSGFENTGARIFNISALANLADAAYDSLTPTRWPCPANAEPAARIAPTTRSLPPTPYRSPAAQNPAYPFQLLTGRLRDQWHTMTRTGTVPRLMAHTPEPCLSIHPDDTTLPENTLIRLSTPHGEATLRLRHDPGLRRNTLFAPMHWTSALCPPARINSAVTDATDPISGQPELKLTPAAIAPADMRWHGFLLSRTRLAPDIAAWCAIIPEPGGIWRHELAGPESPEAAFARLAPAASLHLNDAAHGRHRAIHIADGALQTCLFIERTQALPPRAWLVAQFAATQLPSNLALLSGRLPGAASPAPTICVCHGIDATTITAAISAGHSTVAAIGTATTAGTGCGSCRPEIAALLAARVKEQAA